MNEALIAGLVSDDENAVAAFGESDICVVIDWRDGAEEILDAVMPFLPQDYLAAERQGDTEWVILAGARAAQTVEYGPETRQEAFFVVLNELLAPEFELRQYRPVNGDGYALYLAPKKWWNSFATAHPKVVEKYFLPAERLAAYMRKSYFKRQQAVSAPDHRL